jgi:predicted short-subunit dehydrogenase-like oxidoreductase (DUF2520 family)
MIRVFIIGTGNLAHALAEAFSKTGALQGVYGRKPDAAARLGNKFHVPFCSKIADVPASADVYFLAVSDQAIAELASGLRVDGIIAHCSGMMDLQTLAPHEKTGAFWPLQSFNKNSPSVFHNMPVCIETAREEVMQTLASLAENIGARTQRVSEKQRQLLHLSAVLCNNFPNHLYALAASLLRKNRLDFDLLKPIILQTAVKIKDVDPSKLQTGPAIRHDDVTLRKHLKLLESEENLRTLYELLSRSIQQLGED